MSGYFNSKEIRTFADLFCGIGGFHYAADSLGLECVFSCDIDRDARKQYKHNFGFEPDGDITLIEVDRVPDHEILFAGFPCQPFSIIGKREGFADERGTLIFEIARFLHAKRPQAFVLENVRQIATNRNGKTMNAILETLSDAGYDCDFKLLNALDYGLPQKRERMIIVGMRNGLGQFIWPPKSKERISLSEILETSPDPRHFASEYIRKNRREKHSAKERPAIWHENKSGSVSSHSFSCALRAGASYNYLLVDGERRLTPREQLRLQGFPDKFEIIGNDSQIRKQAGNAVPVPLARAVIKEVLIAVEKSGIQCQKFKRTIPRPHA